MRCAFHVASRNGRIHQLAEGFRPGGPAVDPLAQRVGLAGCDAGRLGHLPQRGARPVGDDVGDLRGAVAPVALVDVLDHLLAALVLDVEVDVGRAVAFGRQEALEQQAEVDRVGLGDPERVTHRAVGRAPPPLAVDVAAAAELHDVVEQEEVAGEAELVDHRQLVVDLVHRLRVPLVRRRIRDRRTAAHQLAQPRHLVVPVGYGIVGQLRRGELQVERARVRDLDRAFHRTRPARETALLLARAAQVRERAGRQPAVELVERTAGAHRRERGRERTARRRGVVHVVGGDHLHARLDRDLRERVVAVAVDRVAVVPQLDEHPVTAERVDQPGERGASRGRTVALQRGGHTPLAAAGEHEPVIVGARGRGAGEVHGRARRVGELRERRAGRALLPRELRLAHRLRQAGVPDRALREDDQVLTRRDRVSRWEAACAPSVSSAPNTVGRPTTRAASANRTTP